MNVGHFGYLLEGNKAHTKVAADRLEMLAKTAAKRYLEERAPLNDTITKIAKENELNSNQIERVCEMANIATHQGLWTKTAQKEKIAFPLADAKVVTAACTGECEGSEDPCSDADSDYQGPPKGLPDGGPSLTDMMGVDPNGGHNGLSEEPERKKIIIILQKKAAERQRLADRIAMAGAELETLEKQAWNAVKQTVMGGASFSRVFEACCGAGLGKVASEYLPQFQDRLIKETFGDTKQRLVKHAISMAPEELISENLGNTMIINGAHPVLVSLDTVQRKNGEIRNGLVGLLRIDDEVKIFNQKLRDLS